MADYPGNDIFIGQDRTTGKPITLSRFDRARHTCIFGSTRSGKSKLVEHMCREDIRQWAKDRCPMIVLDPHGTLYKNLMAYITAEGFAEWPIIPVDLTRGDLIVSYNLLRRLEGVDPSVICRAFVDAILHSWGQSNSNQTPRLATWLHTLLMLAIEKEHTLTEALQIIANPELRRLISQDVQDIVVRGVLQSVQELREREFQDRVESTLYRINRFLSGQILRATFCQTGESLDLTNVITEGKILLANLSVEGTNIHSEDAAAFGSILLTDLWNAVNRRGKREEGEIAPTYVYVDEFQNFVGPTIAKGMAEASGFGLHLHLINQWPGQLVSHGGEVGKLVLDSVLNNAQNKIVFKVDHPDDLEMLTGMLFRHAVDTNKVKDEIISPTVVGYQIQYLKSFNRSSSHGVSHSQQESHSVSHGHSTSRSDSFTLGLQSSEAISDGTSESDTSGFSDTEGTSDSYTDSIGHNSSTTDSHGTSSSDSESDQWSSGTSESHSSSKGSNTGESETTNFGPPGHKFQKEVIDYQGGKLSHLDEEAFEDKFATGVSLTDSEGENSSESSVTGSSNSEGGSRSKSNSTSDSHSVSKGTSDSHSRGRSKSKSLGRSSAHQVGRNRSHQHSRGISVARGVSTSTSESVEESFGSSESFTESQSQTEGENLAPMLMPIMEDRVSSRQFKSVEEQLFEMSQRLNAQQVRQCYVRLASTNLPIALETPLIRPPLTTPELMQQRATEIISSLPFAMPFTTADQNVRSRQDNLMSKLLNQRCNAEPQSTRRRIGSRVVKNTPPQKPPTKQ